MKLPVKVVILGILKLGWIYCDPTASSTNGFLPEHPKLSKSDINSVPAAKGKEVSIGNLAVYQSPYNNVTKLMLISIYDIFGFHPHVKFISDRLAEKGFLAVIPDLFHGDPVPMESFPQPSFMERATQLFAKNGSWTQNKPDLFSVIKYYKEKYGVTGIGMYGFCWGGKISVFAASDPEFTDLKAIGLVHPSRVATDDAAGIKVPAILLPSKSEPDMVPFLEIVNSNVKSHPSEHHRFGELNHGFAGARSDFSDPAVRAAVEQTISMLSDFFRKTIS